jgi:hypothetical protein
MMRSLQRCGDSPGWCIARQLVTVLRR